MSVVWSDIASQVAEALASVQDSETPIDAKIIRKGAKTGPSYDPTFGADVEHPCTIMIGEYKAYQRNGSLIEKNDKKVTVSTEGLTITPTVADRLEINGVKHEIINVGQLAPGDVVVKYTLQVRM